MCDPVTLMYYYYLILPRLPGLVLNSSEQKFGACFSVEKQTVS